LFAFIMTRSFRSVRSQMPAWTSLKLWGKRNGVNVTGSPRNRSSERLSLHEKTPLDVFLDAREGPIELRLNDRAFQGEERAQHRVAPRLESLPIRDPAQCNYILRPPVGVAGSRSAVWTESPWAVRCSRNAA
jgi:hypothetical protein